MAAESNTTRSNVLAQISAPLGFYVLALLIVEATMGLVLASGGFAESDKFYGFLCLAGLFVLVVLLVTFLVAAYPKNLVFTKKEHLPPHIDPMALGDQIRDLIAESVKPDCLADAPPDAEVPTAEPDQRGGAAARRDDHESVVLRALADPKYTWRTVGAVARQAKVTEDDARRILDDSDQVRMSRLPSASGKPLFGLVDRVDE